MTKSKGLSIVHTQAQRASSITNNTLSTPNNTSNTTSTSTQ
jgi:hypothetical protein